MKAVINGKEEIVPLCTCGKCIVKRLRKDHFLSYPYNKNTKSIYNQDYPDQTQLSKVLNDPKHIYNKSKGCNFDNNFRENVPTSLIPTYKNDYKPFKVEAKPNVPKKIEFKEEPPFFGDSSYNKDYPNWGSTLEDKAPLEKVPDIKVPLRGKSNYTESYPFHPTESYNPHDYNKKIIPKSNLKFHGDLNPDTSYNNSFKPVDFNQPHYFNNDNKPKNNNFKTVDFLPDESCPNNFESTYNSTIGNYKDNEECKLRQYLRKRGMTCLVI